MNILVFNSGSSSLKYKLFSMPEGKELLGGEAQKVGPAMTASSRIVHRINGVESIHKVPMTNPAAAFAEVMKLLTAEQAFPIDAIGHRMVHGGTFFTRETIVDEAVLATMKRIENLAPIHNPPSLQIVESCQAQYRSLRQVLVFDTAFHSTIPDYASCCPIPSRICRKLGIRKYGFHGTSHEYVCRQAAEFLGVPFEEFNAVSCHLGSGGASLCAVRQGCSIDNTMGYSPLQGLIMSTRTGQLDAAIPLKLLSLYGNDYHSVSQFLNSRSGILGLSQKYSDIRDVLAETNENSRAVTDAYLWRIQKYLGSYLLYVGDVHAVIFTDTIGETMASVRWEICANLSCFGIQVDYAVNSGEQLKLPADIASADSPVRVLVIQTDEEKAIATKTYWKLN